MGIWTDAASRNHAVSKLVSVARVCEGVREAILPFFNCVYVYIYIYICVCVVVKEVLHFFTGDGV